jgi:hypothetical protein
LEQIVVVPEVVTLGVGLTVISTVEETTVQGPPASGSIELRVKVTIPVVMEGV